MNIVVERPLAPPVITITFTAHQATMLGWLCGRIGGAGTITSPLYLNAAERGITEELREQLATPLYAGLHREGFV